MKRRDSNRTGYIKNFESSKSITINKRITILSIFEVNIFFEINIIRLTIIIIVKCCEYLIHLVPLNPQNHKKGSNAEPNNGKDRLSKVSSISFLFLNKRVKKIIGRIRSIILSYIFQFAYSELFNFSKKVILVDSSINYKPELWCVSTKSAWLSMYSYTEPDS